MTVKELIRQLSEYPDDFPVYRADHEWDPVALTGNVQPVWPEPHVFTGEAQPPGVILV